MKKATIQIHSDGQTVWHKTEGTDRDVCAAITTAAFENPVIRASVINAVIQMFHRKAPALAAEILYQLEIEAPTAKGRQAQRDRVEKLVAA